MASIILTNPTINSGSPVTLLNAELTYSWKSMINTDPMNNGFGTIESQFSGWENPQLSLTFYIPIESTSLLSTSSCITWAQWMSFVKNRYDGTSATKTTLGITLGTSTPLLSYALNSSTTGTSSIPITIKTFSFRTSSDESRNAKWLIINAQITEDK